VYLSVFANKVRKVLVKCRDDIPQKNLHEAANSLRHNARAYLTSVLSGHRHGEPYDLRFPLYLTYLPVMLIEDLIIECQSQKIDERYAAQMIVHLYGSDFDARTPDELRFSEIIENLTPVNDFNYEAIKKRVESVWHKSVGMITEVLAIKDKPEMLIKLKQTLNIII